MDHRREKVAAAPPAPPLFAAPPSAPPLFAAAPRAQPLFAAANSPSGKSPPGHWPMYTRPPDDFLSLSSSPPTPPFQPMHYPSHAPPPRQEQQENLHFVGAPSHVAFSTPPPPPPPPVHSKRKKTPSESGSGRGSLQKKAHVVELEDDPEPSRSAQRLNWTQQEEKRLASAWLELSNDPIEGNGKKRDKYWDDIAAQYNSLTPADRHRDAVQLKSHFQKVKRKINIFHGAYIAMCKLYTSGYGEEQLQAFALEQYQATEKSAFQHLTMWRELKDNGKWLAARRKMNGEQDKIDITSGAIDVEDEERPPGRDTSKDERDGKRKPKESVSLLGEKLDTFIETQKTSRMERQKVIDSQHQLSSQQLETAKLAKETKLIELYQKLLFADTSGMDDESKVERAKAMASLRSILFPEEK